MNRGYAGFYKGYYLRSSYEYAYAKFLDYYSIKWKYEVETFDIGYRLYKPDFFIYNQNGKIEKIVEIKSRDKNAKINATKALNEMKKLFSLNCELVSYEELLVLYKSLPFSLTSTITEWLNSNHTTINKAAFGKLNAHYNLRHSDDTKKRIGEHTKSLWKSDSPSKERMLEGLRKSGMKKGYIKTPREIRVCDGCKKDFEVLITSSQKFCSQKCSGKVAMKRATNSYVHKRKCVHQNIKDYIIKWSINNVETVIKTPYNKIQTSLTPLLEDIYTNFGVKDFRVISKAIFGEDRGRKELLKFMKTVCNEKIC